MSKSPQRILLGLALFLSSSCSLVDCLNCSGTPPRPPPQPGTETYELGCASVIGTVNSWVTYTVDASAEPVSHGQVVTYKITAPIAEPKTPVTTTFESSVATFAVPAGFTVSAVDAEPSSNADFTSASAVMQNGSIVFTLTGDFTFDQTTRVVPTVVVVGTVTATAGQTIVWTTPTIVGKANAGIFGDQTSTCTFSPGGQIWTSTVQ